MAKAPTLVSYVQTGFQTAGTVTTAIITWQAGDVIVCLHGTEASGLLGTPTATGLTFTVLNTNTAGSTCSSTSSWAMATSSGSSTVSATCSTGVSGLAVWVWRGSNGVGSTSEQHTSTKTVSLTPQNNNTRSTVCWSVYDFSAAAVGAAVMAPTANNVREATNFAGHYTYWVGDLNLATGGVQGFGISGGSSVGPFSILAVEVMGNSGLPENYRSIRVGDGMSTTERVR